MLLAVCLVAKIVEGNSATVSQTEEFKKLCQLNESRLFEETESLSKASSLNEKTQSCLLWGTILLEGLGNKKHSMPKLAIAKCESFCKAFSKDLEVRTLQVWWILSLGDKYMMPDFHHPDRIQYSTIMVNGKPTLEPIYIQDSMSPIVKKALAVKEEIVKKDIRNPITYLYRILNPSGDRRITSRELELLASQSANPIRYYAEAELAKRDEIKGLSSNIRSEWTSLASGKPDSVYLRMAIYHSSH